MSAQRPGWASPMTLEESNRRWFAAARDPVNFCQTCRRWRWMRPLATCPPGSHDKDAADYMVFYDQPQSWGKSEPFKE